MKRNSRIYIVSQFLSAMVFTIPIWIVYYQGRITVTQISLLIALQYASQLFFELPTGAFADLVGRRWSVAAGYLFWGINALLIFFSVGFFPLILATILGGLAESLISGSLEALIYDSLAQDGQESSFSKLSARSSFWYQIALALGTASGGFLYQVWHGLPYVLYALTCSLAAILALFFIEPRLDSKKFSLKNYLLQIKEGTKHAFATKKVALMSLFYIAVASITWTNNLYFFDFMLLELGLSPEVRGIVGGGIRIFNISVLTFLLSNERIFTKTRSFFFFPFMMLVCFLPGFLFRGNWPLLFVMGSVMVGTARWVILTRYTNEMFSSKYRATAISALSMVIGLFFVAITVISGPVIEHLGGVKTMYTFLGLLTLVTVLPLSFLVTAAQKKVICDTF